MKRDAAFNSLIVCAGGGGLALGLEQAGFEPALLLDNRSVACETLRLNRPKWDVESCDLLDFDPINEPRLLDIDLLAAGLPRLKASAAVARTRGTEYESSLVQAVAFLVHGVQPRALLIDNVPELATSDAYAPLRSMVEVELEHIGYSYRWFVVNAADIGVPQDRKHGVLIAFKDREVDGIKVFEGIPDSWKTVGEALRESMEARGWEDAGEWATQAAVLAPTLVGGSWDRGGPDLGPTGSKRAWARIGVDGGTVADRVPGPDFVWDPSQGRPGMVKLTVDQAAILQGFPAEWRFAGRKTAQYRQVANAMPPPLARALGMAIAALLR